METTKFIFTCVFYSIMIAFAVIMLLIAIKQHKIAKRELILLNAELIKKYEEYKKLGLAKEEKEDGKKRRVRKGNK